MQAATTTHQALSVPELLTLYLGYLPRTSLLVAARVCRTWSAIALQVLYSTHELSLRFLLRKLEHKVLVREKGFGWMPVRNSICSSLSTAF